MNKKLRWHFWWKYAEAYIFLKYFSKYNSLIDSYAHTSDDITVCENSSCKESSNKESRKTLSNSCKIRNVYNHPTKTL